jgi:hypothetical protein
VRINSQATTTSWLTLFASIGTLICCALPLLLVTLGFGAAVASLTHSVPFLISLSEHKEWIFAGSGALLLASAWLLYRPGQACPADPALARLCSEARRWNARAFWVSVVTWGIGFFAAYLVLPLWLWLDA